MTDHGSLYQRLGAVLSQAGYRAEGRPSGSYAADDVQPDDVAAWLLAQGRGDERLRTLVGLFLEGAAVEPDRARRALSPLSVSACAAAGLIEEDDTVRALVTITPFEGLLVLGEGRRVGGRTDYVMRVNRSSATLADLTIRRPVERALDLATGSGVQALLASRHTRAVTATDVNERALEFARRSAVLNGAQNIDFRRGDMFDPVRGEQFDLVVANPPFVISPDRELMYRDSDLPMDEISRRVLAAAPSHLREGGFASILCNWVYEGEDWQARLRDWLDGSGCDALLIHYSTQNPLVYAAMYHHALHAVDRRGFRDAVQRWVDYYDRAGVERIGVGVVVLRRTGGRPWVRAVEAEAFPSGPGGDQLLRIFAGTDFVCGPGKREDALMGAAYALGAGCTVEPVGPQEVVVRLPRGVGLQARVSQDAVSALRRSAGREALRDVVPDAARHEVLPGLRVLLEGGFATVRTDAPMSSTMLAP